MEAQDPRPDEAVDQEKHSSSSDSSSSSSEAESKPNEELQVASDAGELPESAAEPPLTEEVKAETPESLHSTTETESKITEALQDVKEDEIPLPKEEESQPQKREELEDKEAAEPASLAVDEAKPKAAEVNPAQESEAPKLKAPFVNPLSATSPQIEEQKAIAPPKQPEPPKIEEEVNPSTQLVEVAPVIIDAKPAAKPVESHSKTYDVAKENSQQAESQQPVSKMDDRAAPLAKHSTSSRVPEAGRSQCMKCRLF